MKYVVLAYDCDIFFNYRLLVLCLHLYAYFPYIFVTIPYLYPEDESINSKALGTSFCLSFSRGTSLYLNRLPLAIFFSIMEATRNFYVFSVNFPSLVLFVFSFCSALIKAHKLKLRLAFLRRCTSEQVMPKSILPPGESLH